MGAASPSGDVACRPSGPTRPLISCWPRELALEGFMGVKPAPSGPLERAVRCAPSRARWGHAVVHWPSCGAFRALNVQCIALSRLCSASFCTSGIAQIVPSPPRGVSRKCHLQRSFRCLILSFALPINSYIVMTRTSVQVIGKSC